MSLRRGEYEVWCDHAPDDDPTDVCGTWAGTGEWRVAEATKEAVRMGWTKTGRKWLCPGHAKKHAADAAKEAP